MTRPAPLAGAGRVAGAAALIAVLTVVSPARRVRPHRRVHLGRRTRPTSAASTCVANTVPNIIFEIVAGGALASLVVPLLAGPVATGDRRRWPRTTGALLTWTVTLLVPLAALVALFADPVVAVCCTTGCRRPSWPPGHGCCGCSPRNCRCTASGIVLTGVLQAHRRFAWPVLAPLLSSLTVMVAYLVFARRPRGGTRARPA